MATKDTNSSEFKSDFRKLDYMLKDLNNMYTELVPEGNLKNNEDLKNMDKWQRKKYDLNKKIKEINEGVNRLDEAKRTLAPGQRDAEVIKLHAENSKNLKEANAMWTELKQIFLEDEQKKKKKLDKKTLTDRRILTKNLGKELMDLHSRNARVQQGPTVETKFATQSTGGEEDLSKLDRDARREKRLEKKREERRRTKNKRRGRGGSSRKEDEELDEFQEPKPMSAQEQAFIEEKDAAYKEQDAILEEISKGLDELHEIGISMNKNLKLQEHMLNELGDKIETQTEAFKNANLRLKNLLDESGGLSRWCPIVICAIIFIALLGVIYSMVH